jgi:chromate transport protein ChrA
MSLQSYVQHTVHGVVDRIRRDVIAYGICAVSAVAIIVLATWAAVLSLIRVVGPIYAPLIVAGGYLLIILVTMLWRQFADGRKAQPIVPPLNVSSNAETVQRQAQFVQVAMIVEALMLGFSLSRRFDRR